MRLRQQAERCRRLAQEAVSPDVQGDFKAMAEQYEILAEHLEALAKSRPRYP
jgi:hypothetical protein